MHPCIYISSKVTASQAPQPLQNHKTTLRPAASPISSPPSSASASRCTSARRPSRPACPNGAPAPSAQQRSCRPAHSRRRRACRASLPRWRGGSNPTTMATKQSLLVLSLLAAACILLLVPSASAATAIEYCNKHKDYPVKVTGVEIVPDPVQRGAEATFKISATTDKTITEGKLCIDVKYWIIGVHSETDDICSKTTCPATGGFELSHSQTLPSFTPPGSYTIEMKMLGQNDEELSCISFGFSIGFLAPLALSSI